MPNPAIHISTQIAGGRSLPTSGVWHPSMSSDQILSGRVLAGGSDLESDQVVSFRLIQQVGEGGMGLVYRAEQDYPRRIVAFKVMKGAAAVPRNIQRFEREISILAQLQHVGIAQLFSVGVVETGLSGTLPFLAMEFVEGVPITEFAASNSLNLRRKVELMTHVCEAVAHAHGQGIIHRDLKPSNILVSHSGSPKILDFGLATIIDEARTKELTLTEEGQLLGTLDYMSPEQALGKKHGVDQRTDVYALGVVLFELLAGRRPLDLSSCSAIEAIQKLQDAQMTALVSASRVFRGDLDVIVNKAISKDREQRYSTVTALMEDLRRYLASEPILARRPTGAYRAKKFVRRNRLLVASVSAIIVALSMGLVMTARESRRANIAAKVAVSEARSAKIYAAQASLSEGNALMATQNFALARKAYNNTWNILESLELPTRPAELGIWELDCHSGRPIRVLAEDAGSVQCAAISTDQRMIALGFANGQIQLRDVLTNQIAFETQIAKNPQCMKFSPNGKFLLIGDATECDIWNIQAHTKITSQQIPNSNGLLMAISDNSVALCDFDGQLYFSSFDLLSTTPPILLPGRPFQGLGIDGDSAYIVGAQSQVLQVSHGNVETIGNFPSNASQRVAFSSDGKRVALMGKTVAVVDLPSLKQIASFENYGGATEGGFIDQDTLWLPNPNGMTIDYVRLNGSVSARIPYFQINPAVACGDLLALLPDEDGQLVLFASHVPAAAKILCPITDHPVAGALNADGRIAAVGLNDGRLRLFDTLGGHVLGELGIGASIKSVYFDAKTTRLAVITGNQEIQIWNLLDFRKEFELALKLPVRVFAFSPSGNICCYSVEGKQGAVALNLESHVAEPTSIDVPFNVRGIAFSDEDAQCVLVGPEGGTLWNMLASPQKLSTFAAPFEGASRAAFLSGTNTLVTTNRANDLRVWQVFSTTLQAKPLAKLPKTFRSWSAAGKSLAIRDSETLTLFDPATDFIIRRIQWPRESGQPIAFSIDGSRFLALGDAGISFNDWASPNAIRSFDRPMDNLGNARWFTTAGLPELIGSFPQSDNLHSMAIVDAYGYWSTRDLSNAHRVFSGVTDLTDGVKSLLTHAMTFGLEQNP